MLHKANHMNIGPKSISTVSNTLSYTLVVGSGLKANVFIVNVNAFNILTLLIMLKPAIPTNRVINIKKISILNCFGSGSLMANHLY